jgi:hypothetical protein
MKYEMVWSDGTFPVLQPPVVRREMTGSIKKNDVYSGHNGTERKFPERLNTKKAGENEEGKSEGKRVDVFCVPPHAEGGRTVLAICRRRQHLC